MSAVEFELVGYEPSELHYTRLMIDLLADRLFGIPRQFPPLRSSVVTIQRISAVRADGSHAHPVYAAGGDRELIQLPSQERLYWQFGYQLAHELSHLAARADLRFPRSDGLHWIEEAMCECYSLIGMNAVASQPSYLQENAIGYLRTNMPTFHRAQPLDRVWYERNALDLQKARRLEGPVFDVAQHLYGHVTEDQLLIDNLLIRELPTGEAMPEFLSLWHADRGGTLTTPRSLAQFCLTAEERSAAGLD